MPLSIECPTCASRYKVGDHLAGKRVKCKKCAGGIHVPDAPDLDKAKELPLRMDPDEAPATIEPIVVSKKPVKHKAPEGSPVARAEAFVAQEAFTPALVGGAGAAGGLSTFNDPRQIITRPPSSQYSPARGVRASTAAPEGFSPMLLLVYLIVAFAGAIYMVNKPHADVSAIWTLTISEIVLFFSVVAPCTLLGIWGASKALRFELASPAYIKSAAVAVAPALLAILLGKLPPNPAILALGLLAIFPATFFITMLVFSLDWVESLVTFLLGGIGCIVGRVVQVVLLALIIAGTGTANHQPQLADVQPVAPPPDTYSPPPNPYSPPPVAQFDHVLVELTSIDQEARAMSRNNWMGDTSKEHATAQLSNLQNQLESLRPQATSVDQVAKLNEAVNDLSDLATKVSQLPSESPDAQIFQPIDTGQTWRPSSGDPTVPISFKRYRMLVPTDAKVDLNSSEDAPEGMTWTVPPRGQINITALDRKDPRQERPWVRTKGFMHSDNPDLFTLDLVNIPVDITYGKLGDLPATRIASHLSGDGNSRFVPDRFVKYVLADGHSWVVITATADASDARTLNTLENAAFSVRQARGDEPRIDPFTPDAMVGRLREEKAEILVRRMGTKAEPALLARIGDTDGLLRAKVLELLADCGTKNALPVLLPLCNDENTRYAELARAAVKKISPADMDPPTEALLDIQSKNFQVREKGVELLAAAQPKADDPRKPKICTILTGMVRDHQQGFGIKAEALGDAIAVWQTPDTVKSLLPLLDYQRGAPPRTAMIVLARSRDKHAAFPICRWLIEDTADAQEALTSMGPVAEDDVIKVLVEKNDKARLAAINILAEIGTQKSLKPLGYVVSDKRALADVDAGNAAIAEIRERIGKPNASATPDPKPSPGSGERPQVNDPALNGNIWIPPTTSGPPKTTPK